MTGFLSRRDRGTPPLTPLRVLGASAALAAFLSTAGCASAADPTTSPSATSPSATGPPTTSPSTTSASAPTASQENPLRITITVDGTEFSGVLADNAAARGLLAQLPIDDLAMSDHGGVEKTGRLPEALPLDGLPSGADPAVGDIGYYAPGQDLVLYHGDQSYFEGIVVLGRLDGGVDTLAGLIGDVSVSVRAAT